jgi:hypothetical protein
MAQERIVTKEDESVWKSRLFKFGVVVAAVSAAVGAFKVAAAGVLIAGVAWAAWKGK